MEAEGEEDVVPCQSFIPCVEVALGHGEGVSEVQRAVHVGEGKGLEEFLLVGGLYGEKLVALPDGSGALLECDELVAAGCVLHLPIN